MKFSLVVPVYGTERFLPRCLDSLKAQSDPDFEVVVVDDYSPGRGETAEEIVARYDDRFRCIRHQKNRSAFQARCTGIAAAKGDYVVPVDPDDYLQPETLAKLRETIDRVTPDVVSYWMDYDDGKRVYPHWCRHPAAVVTGATALQELAEHKYFTGVASKAFLRERLQTAIHALAAPEDLYVNTSDDLLMLLPALALSRTVAFLDYSGYRYFVNPKSASFSWRTTNGLQRGCQQTRQVVDLVQGAVFAAECDESVCTCVQEIANGIERWFVGVAVDCPTADLEERLAVVRASFHAENVADELQQQLKSIRLSRSYRLVNGLSRFLLRRDR